MRKTIVELIGQARELDNDIIDYIHCEQRQLPSGLWVKENLLIARQKLAEALNELLRVE